MNSGSSHTGSSGDRAWVDGWLRLCPSTSLVNGGQAVLFDLPLRPGARMVRRGFAVRYEGRVRAYVNRCAHVPVALDWVPGQVFGPDGRTLLCSVHGAEYDPASGRCLSGPCSGRGHLESLGAAERDGWIWVACGNGSRHDRVAADTDPPATLDFRDDD